MAVLGNASNSDLVEFLLVKVDNVGGDAMAELYGCDD